ncbi:MAG: ATP-binding protein [Phycisphaerales bacterium]|nr:ATP-binding protein [Phycisphaerales bacterium]
MHTHLRSLAHSFATLLPLVCVGFLAVSAAAQEIAPPIATDSLPTVFGVEVTHVLGLPVSRALAEGMGASLRLINTEHGTGATFELRVPRGIS